MKWLKKLGTILGKAYKTFWEIAEVPFLLATRVNLFVVVVVIPFGIGVLVSRLYEDRDLPTGTCVMEVAKEPWDVQYMPVFKITEVGNKFYKVKSFGYTVIQDQNGLRLADVSNRRYWSGEAIEKKTVINRFPEVPCPQ